MASKKKVSLSDHFEHDPDAPIPTEFNIHPELQKEYNGGYAISEWQCSKKYNFMMIPYLTNARGDQKLFTVAAYCMHCSKWLSISGSFRNIKRHAETDMSKQGGFTVVDDDEDVQQSPYIIQDPEVAAKTKRALIKALILNGIAFSLVEDENLNKICKLCCREKLTEITEKVSEKIKSRLKALLNESKYLTLAVDEWKDKAKRRYLGITSHCIVKNSYMEATIVQVPIKAVRVTNDIIWDMISIVMTEYNIGEKVKYIVTDNGANMIAAITGDKYVRLSCICHCLNIFMNSLIENLPELSYVTKLQGIISKSGNFTAYAIKEKFSYTTVPSYTPTRWYSLLEMVSHIVMLAPLIRSYSAKYPVEFIEINFESDVLPLCNHLKPVLEILKQAYETLESDNFGAVSYVLYRMKTLKQAVIDFQAKSPLYNDACMAFNDAYNNYWEKYEDTWKPLFLTACRLNPNLTWSKLTAEEINFADREITERMKKYNTVPREVPLSAPNQNNHDEPTNIAYAPDERVITASSDNATMLRNYIQSITDTTNKVDLLEYWCSKMNQGWRPLESVALDVLSTLITSASAERQFSSCNRSVNYHRLKLTAEHVQDVGMIVGNQKIASNVIDSIMANE